MPLRQRIKKLGKRLQFGLEYLFSGGRARETLLLGLLDHHYRGVFRRDWKYCDEPPHFATHRHAIFQQVFGSSPVMPDNWYRGIFASEVIQRQDWVLDIGCGDGFFAGRYFSPKCHQVDAVDVEPTAIRRARHYHSADNVQYHLLDAIREPFPRARYDVVVWDGAIGHFPADATHRMLAKISGALSEEGVFVGSETLGDSEGHDHLQFFASLEDLHSLLSEHFPLVELKSATFPIRGLKTPRTEAYWRCAKLSARLDACAWRRLAPAGGQIRRAA